MKLALSILCENPHRRTGLTTLFHEFVSHARRNRTDIDWIIFAGPDQEWSMEDGSVEVVRNFPANDRRNVRLWADHFRVAPEAARRGAAALLTVGFGPLRTAGLPFVMHVLTIHHRSGRGGLRAWYRRAAVSRGLRKARLVITNSKWTADQLGPMRAPLLVSHEGLQRDRFSADGPRGLPGLAKGYLLWVGNFYSYKRAELALAAYAGLPPALRSDLPFVLVGGDWEGGRQRAEATARALGIERDVRFLGWVRDDELPALYRGARAHIMATAEETFGRSSVEAMACGCPSVLQDLPVLREVTNGAALFVDFADTPASSAALHRICIDDALAHELHEAGLRRAADFSFEKLARERLEAIMGVLPRSSSR